jgi:hypothetical protein
MTPRSLVRLRDIKTSMKDRGAQDEMLMVENFTMLLFGLFRRYNKSQYRSEIGV